MSGRQLKRNVTIRRIPSGSANRVSRQSSFSSSRALVVSAPRRKKSYGMKGPEVKYFDTTLQVAATSSGRVSSLSLMSQGTTNVQRVGNKTQIKSVASKGDIKWDAAGITSHPPGFHVVSIILDKEPELGAIATWADIYSIDETTSFLNINNSDRFVVLGTFRGHTGASSNTVGGIYGVGPAGIDYDMFRAVDIAAKYVNTTAAQASAGSNQLLLAYISDVTDNACIMTMNCRIRYTDE